MPTRSLGDDRNRSVFPRSWRLPNKSVLAGGFHCHTMRPDALVQIWRKWDMEGPALYLHVQPRLVGISEVGPFTFCCLELRRSFAWLATDAQYIVVCLCTCKYEATKQRNYSKLKRQTAAGPVISMQPWPWKFQRAVPQGDISYQFPSAKLTSPSGASTAPRRNHWIEATGNQGLFVIFPS